MLTLVSPAKLNLFLKVLSRRSDGYHELASLFQTIDLVDHITFAWAKEDSFTCNLPHLENAENLVLRALRLFRKKHFLKEGISLHLHKNIPLEAGFGGGSSNAATTLYGLNCLHGSPYSDEELQEMGSELGSDVPFFFSHGTAYCEGRGEKVTNLPPLQEKRYLSLHKPQEGLSTSLVYRALNPRTFTPVEPLIFDQINKSKPFYYNDLEEPACRLLPSLSAFKKDLEERFSLVMMTGSGTAFFALDEQKKAPVHKFIRRTPLQWYEI